MSYSGSEPLPAGLLSVIGREQREFVVRAGRSRVAAQSCGLILFVVILLGIFLPPILSVLGFIGIFALVFFMEQSPNATALDWVAATAAAVVPFLAVFVIFYGFYVLLVRPFFRKGGWFVATPTRLISFEGKTVQSFQWEQFTGEILIHGDAQKATMILSLRPQQGVPDQSRSAMTPDAVYMLAVSDVFTLEKTCRRLMRENDPDAADKEVL